MTRVVSTARCPKRPAEFSILDLLTGSPRCLIGVGVETGLLLALAPLAGSDSRLLSQSEEKLGLGECLERELDSNSVAVMNEGGVGRREELPALSRPASRLTARLPEQFNPFD